MYSIKRTGITSAALFLRINGVRIECSQAEMESFTLEVASSHAPIEKLAEWLREHSKPI
jgi:prophage maintenance system killer protein